MTRQLLFVTAMLTFGDAAFGESPFVGTWKQNRAKTQRDSRGQVLKIESDGEGGIRYFSGRPVYGGALDGSKRPGLETFTSDTFVLQKNGGRGYTSTLSRNGVDLQREVVEVSADGKTLTASFTDLTPRKDGKQPTTTFTFVRNGGEAKPYPFIGVWKDDPTRTKWGEDDPAPMIISESGGVLTISNPVNDNKTIVDLAKGEVTATGPAATDVTRSARKAGERSFEMAITRKGVTRKILYEVSADGKTLSSRLSWTDDEGRQRSSLSVYERQ